MDAECQAVADELNSLVQQFDSLMALLAEGPLRDQQKKQLARTKLEQLKSRLKDRCHELHLRRDSLNAAQRHSLKPALDEAKAHLKVATSSTPDQKWISQLYDARGDLKFMLTHLGPSSAE